MKKNSINILWYGFIVFLVFGFIIRPFSSTVIKSLETGKGNCLDNYIEFFSNPNLLTVLKNTILLGISAVITCGIVGSVLALYMTFVRLRFKRIIHILLLSPMMVPGIIIVISFIQLYGESGLVTKMIQYVLHMDNVPYVFQGFGAILFVITFTQYVYFYLNVYISLKYLDYSTIEAARSLGASGLRIFTDIIWPVIRPAVLSSVIITFASGISAFSAPNLIGGGFKVLSTQIVRSKANNHMEMASVEVVILFCLSMVVLFTIHQYSRRFNDDKSDRVPVAVPSLPQRGVRLFFGNTIVLLQIILILLPIITIIYLSFVSTASIMTDIFPIRFTLDNYITIFNKKRVLKPILNSFNMTLIAVVAGLVITVPSAYLIVKNNRKTDLILRFLLMLPVAMPANLVAIDLINAFSQKSVFVFNQVLLGNYYIIPVAYTITAIPLLLVSNEAAIRGIQSNLEEASRSLGANMLITFKAVILPNIASGIISGGILILIRLIGEYTMSALLYGVHNRPVSISMITNMQEYNVGISLAYGVIVIVFCYISLACIMIIDRKRFI